MKQLILLIQNQTHVDALPATAKDIVRAGYNRVWIVVSPAIAVDANAASAKFDAEIADLERSRDAAYKVFDFQSSESHHLKAQGKILDRDKAITDAWKSVPEEDRMVVYAAKLAPLKAVFEPAGVSASPHILSEHFPVEQVFQMLNGLSGKWPKTFVHGTYMFGSPGAIPEGQKSDVGIAGPPNPATVVSAEDKEKYREQSQAAQKPKTRREELEDTHHMSLRPLAKGLGIDPTGKSTAEIIDAILAAEAAKTTEPALAEY